MIANLCEEKISFSSCEMSDHLPDHFIFSICSLFICASFFSRNANAVNIDASPFRSSLPQQLRRGGAEKFPVKLFNQSGAQLEVLRHQLLMDSLLFKYFFSMG